MTFEELLELASQADAAAAGRGESGAKSTAAAPRSVRTPGDTLSDALPPGSSARRAAVAALGNEIHTRLLRNNVIPSSAVLAAALLPPELIGETWEAGSMVCCTSTPVYHQLKMCHVPPGAWSAHCSVSLSKRLDCQAQV